MSIQKLVIVESPAKAKTINRFLGKDYRVVASMGHIRDLPETLLGIDIKNDFRPMYEESKRKQKILTDLRTMAREVKEIYLAPDPDREGEAIAWHLYEILKGCNKSVKFFRVSFHEITANAIHKAFESAGKINMNLVDAQQARRVLDRLVGYQVSPLLWSSIERGRGISAGRVQSVALRLVVERERDIENFKSEEFWNLWTTLEVEPKNSGKRFRGKFTRLMDGKKQEIKNREDADTILKAIEGKKQVVITAENASRTKHPAPPFITSTLQQIAGSVLRFSAKQTMQVAQELYEGIEITGLGSVGLITYMRTDSVNIAREAQESARAFIESQFGAAYVPAKLPVYRNKNTAQEAHEAIRPTDTTLTPEKLRAFLSPAQQKLYTLIWKRFIASQMASATQRRTTVETLAESTPYVFKAVTTETLFPGYLKVFGEEEKQAANEGVMESDEDANLPMQFLHELKKGENCVFCGTDAEQKFTEPPPRFSEATLVKELETNGIGRPSTYATIVNTIQERKYVSRAKGKLAPTELGFRVNDYLVEHLPALFQVGFTASMENKLDEIEEGQIRWVDMMKEFYNESFVGWLESAKLQNAPESEPSKRLLEILMNQVTTWNPPVNEAGKRSYDDRRFIGSIMRQFEKNGRITEKQWNTLLQLAVSYQAQLPGLDALAHEFKFEDKLTELRQRQNDAENQPPVEVDANMKALMSALSEVDFEPPADTPPRAFNEGKFVRSIQDQVLSGKQLSPKQQATLTRLIENYIEKYPQLHELAEKASLTLKKAQNAVVDRMSDEQLTKIKTMIEFLNSHTAWDAPVKRGQKTYDDSSFFESMRNQFETNHTLSPRQYNALLRMYDRYNDATGKKKETRQKIFNNTKNTGDETGEMLAVLEKVDTWEPGKGRFDDKRFYESLKKQHESGKILSEKQRDILFKIVKKYTSKEK